MKNKKQQSHVENLPKGAREALPVSKRRGGPPLHGIIDYQKKGATVMTESLDKVLVSEETLTVRQLLDYLDEYNLGYEIVANGWAQDLAIELGLNYPWSGVDGYTGSYEGDDITCFIVIGDELCVWAIFGTVDFSTIAHERHPGWQDRDACRRVK